MADNRALGRLGWAFGAITGAVLLAAALVVASRPDQPAGPGTARWAAAATQSSTAR